MKRQIGSLLCLVLSILFLHAAVPLLADEAFKIHVKQRGIANQEVGQVRVLLELAAAPAGATLKVAGQVLALDDPLKNIGGDLFRLTSATGNAVAVIYIPRSNFGADFCTGAGAVEKNVLVDFGPQDIVAYRIASYVVGAPSAECSKAFKRVSASNSGAEVIPAVDGGIPALVATDKGRIPIDVVLVLDKSGSMSELPPGATTGATKMAILHSALDAFINQWESLDKDVVGGTELKNDRIGTISFASSETVEKPDGVNFFISRGENAPGPGHNWQAVRNTITALTPTSATALGKGINQGMLQWDQDRQNDLFMVVVTDGKQNRDPKVLPAGSGFLALPPPSVNFTDELRKRYIPIQTVAFGMPASETTLLKNISQETSGRDFEALNDTGLYDTFVNLLVNILKGNTASLAMRRHESFTGVPSALMPVVVDQSVQRVVFSLQWTPPLRNILKLEVFPPGTSPTPGGGGAAPDSTADAPQSTTQGFDVTNTQVGTWNVRVVAANNDVGAVPYSLSVFFRERALDYRIEFDRIHQGTGDDLTARVEIGYDHQPLAGLPTNAIRAHIQRPGEAFGTILHDTPVDPNILNNPPPTAGDTKTPYEAKVAALTNSQLIDRIIPKDVSTVSLKDQGNGVYTATFSDTSIPGVYRFEFLLDWTDPRTGHVRREERLEREVKVTPSAAATAISVSNGAAPNSRVITVIPRDKFHNYLGPGFDSLVTATLHSTGILVPGPPADPDQTGTYKFTVTDVPPGETPKVDVVVDQVPVGSSTPPPGGGGGRRFFIDVGPNFPHGAFGNGVDGKWSINVGLERLLPNNWSVEGILGYHTFDSAFVSNPRIWQLSIGGKRYFGTAPWHPFLDASIGAYRFDPGNTTKFGANAGAGVLYDFRSTWGIEGVYQYHSINVSGATDRFSTVQLGLRVRF